MSYTLAELRSAIADYCQNSEASFVSHLNDFIISAEDKVFAATRMSPFWLEQNTLVTADGTAEYTLGPGTLEVKSVRVGKTAVSGAEEVVDGPVGYLLRKDYDFLLEAYPGTSSAVSEGVPKYYAVSGAGVTSDSPNLTIRVGPTPDAVYPITVELYAKSTGTSLTGITADTYTWLSATFPQVLLNGSLAEAYAYMKGEPDLLAHYGSEFNAGLSSIKNLGEGRQPHDDFTDGEPSIQAR